MLVAQMMRNGWESTASPRNFPRFGMMHPSGYWNGQYGNAFGVVHLVFGFITWIVLLAVLVALARLLWLKGDKERKGK